MERRRMSDMANADEVLEVLADHAGQMTYPDLLDALTDTAGTGVLLERMEREKRIDQLDGGRVPMRPWRESYGCAVCDPVCAGCNVGPLVVRAIIEGTPPTYRVTEADLDDAFKLAHDAVSTGELHGHELLDQLHADLRDAVERRHGSDPQGSGQSTDPLASGRKAPNPEGVPPVLSGQEEKEES
jgi:hypothetical protein